MQLNYNISLHAARMHALGRSISAQRLGWHRWGAEMTALDLRSLTRDGRPVTPPLASPPAGSVSGVPSVTRSWLSRGAPAALAHTGLGFPAGRGVVPGRR